MYRELILDIETGKETWRDYTDEEIAKVEEAQAKAAKLLAERAKQEAARKAIFEKLGLSPEEVKTLLG